MEATCSLPVRPIKVGPDQIPKIDPTAKFASMIEEPSRGSKETENPGFPIDIFRGNIKDYIIFEFILSIWNERKRKKNRLWGGVGLPTPLGDGRDKKKFFFGGGTILIKSFVVVLKKFFKGLY